MNSTIRLLTHERQLVTAINPNRFELNPRGRLLWLQRFLFAVLRKLKANALDTSVEVKTVDIDCEKILDAIMKNRADVEALYYRRARYLIIGARNFAEFMSGPEYREILQFTYSIPIGINRRRTILGLEVVVVPWIDGFFVLPDLEEEKTIHAGAR